MWWKPEASERKIWEGPSAPWSICHGSDQWLVRPRIVSPGAAAWEAGKSGKSHPHPRSPEGGDKPSRFFSVFIHSLMPPRSISSPHNLRVKEMLEALPSACWIRHRGMVCRDAVPLVCCKRRGGQRSARCAHPGTPILPILPETGGEERIYVWGRLTGAGHSCDE